MRRSIVAVTGLALSCASAPSLPTARSVVPVTGASPSSNPEPRVEDPYLWLEDISGEKALAWVQQQNERSLALLANDEQRALESRFKSIYDSEENLPHVAKRGDYLYNFWQDAQHARGLWRRTTLAEYKKKEPHWEVLLDLDALAQTEHENWVFSGITWLQPSYSRALVSLSRGGGDAVVVREYDVHAKAFVPDGFNLPEAKSNVTWQDADTLYVGTDFGPGSLTESGYPRIAKLWKRGTPLTAATTLYEARPADITVSAWRDWHQGKSLDVVQRAVSFFDSETYLLENGKLEKLDKPDDVDASFFDDFVLFRPRTAWTRDGHEWPAGSLLAAPLAAYRRGERQLQMVYTPAPNRALSGVDGTKHALLLNVLEDVHTKLLVMRFVKGAWTQHELPGLGLGSFDASAYDDDHDDRYWFSSEDFISPVKLELGDLNHPSREALRSAPSFFDAKGLEVTQHFATSKDGTRVPYFQVAKRDLQPTGDHPVLLNAYGGFEVSLTPHYSVNAGAAWLERGGVFVQANIRGGGEYGPAWHEAALKSQRQRAYDDFIAVAEDLIARKVTQPKRLGIQGASNGGLLMGVMLTQRPDLFGAIVCSVPLLDMKRYHKLLAGASWMGEYGDPDVPEEWAWLAKFSPYQNVKPGVHYPRVLFTTSTRDDRVHPGHARKMVARMLEQGHDVLYFENTEGGHAGAANNAQRAHVYALEYEYLYQQLMRQ
jgi:prolyl oligopeptidase